MKSTPVTLSVARALRPETVRELGLRRDFARKISSVVCAALVVVAFGACATEDQAPPANPITKPGSGGLAKGSDDSRCVEGEYQEFDKATGDQVIKLFVKRQFGKQPMYEITPVPRCAKLSTTGNLTFEVNWEDAKKDMTTYKVGTYAYLTFGQPSLSDPAPRIKGPYAIDKSNPNNTKWGIYDKITDKVVLPETTFSPDVKPGWVDTYAVTVYGPDGAFLGEVDPGVKVVEGP